jgi:hypothetical protein
VNNEMVVRSSGSGAAEVTGGRWAIQEGKARQEEEGSPKPNTMRKRELDNAPCLAVRP